MTRSIQLFSLIFSFFLSMNIYAETATYEGKVQSIYLHDRDADPYFGIELEGSLTNNPCGNYLKVFAVALADLNEHHLSMLMAAQLANRDVEISNNGSSSPCRGTLPTFNFVRLK